MTDNPEKPEAGPPPVRRTPVAMDGAAFRQAGHELVDRVADFLGSLPTRPVTRASSPERIRELLGADAGLPAEGAPARELLASAAELLFEHSLFNGHPRFFGYITSPPAPIGILAELLAAAVNPNVGAWQLSPVASEIEEQTLRWMADLVGFPRGGAGILVSGGNAANTVGFLAARRAACGEGVRRAGLADAETPRLRVYASGETHTWIHKAADLGGLGTDAIRWIGTDAGQRLKTDELRRALAADREAGYRPMLVVGTAGSVSTGAIDPLGEIAGICREAGVWFHVDGAYGGFAAADPEAPAELRALSLADSVALDPHKWLYAPLEAGALLVRDRERLRDAFSYHPPYYHFGTEATNFVDLGPQNSRGFRALKVWLALRQAGRDGYTRMIADDIRLSRRLSELVAKRPELELVTQSLSITTFRYVPEPLPEKVGTESRGDYLNRLNQRLLERIQVSGEAFVSNAVVDGRFLLRACIVNFRTAPPDLEALVELVIRLGAEEDAALRPGAAG